MRYILCECCCYWCNQGVLEVLPYPYLPDILSTRDGPFGNLNQVWHRLIHPYTSQLLTVHPESGGGPRTSHLLPRSFSRSYICDICYTLFFLSLLHDSCSSTPLTLPIITSTFSFFVSAYLPLSLISYVLCISSLNCFLKKGWSWQHRYDACPIVPLLYLPVSL